MSHRLLDYRPTIDALEGPAIASNRYAAWSDARELQQAAELLEYADEGALETYLVEMVGRANGRTVARRPSSGVRMALARILGRIGRPLLRQGGASQRASAGRVFGLELEGLSPEDQAFEVARHFARFATDAARRASQDHAAGSSHAIASRAVIAAAQTFAPGCCGHRNSAAALGSRMSGFAGGAISSSSTSSPVSRRPGLSTS